MNKRHHAYYGDGDRLEMGYVYEDPQYGICTDEGGYELRWTGRYTTLPGWLDGRCRVYESLSGREIMVPVEVM